MSRLRRRGATLGFTLLELLIVLAILGLLAGLVGPRLLDALSGARSDTAKLQIKNIEAALDMFRLDTGRYPSESEGLKALMERPADVRRWRGPYLKSADGLLDPWGQPYKYRPGPTATEYEILSLGADKAEGGDGENAGKDVRAKYVPAVGRTALCVYAAIVVFLTLCTLIRPARFMAWARS